MLGNDLILHYLKQIFFSELSLSYQINYISIFVRLQLTTHTLKIEFAPAKKANVCMSFILVLPADNLIYDLAS